MSDEELSRRAALKAAIKRATVEATGRAYALDAISQEQLRRIYQQAHDDIVRSIQQAGGSDGIVRIHKLRQLQSDIDARLKALSGQRDGVLLENLAQGAANGAGPFAEILGAGFASQVADAATRQAHHFVAADGMQLSDRLWRLDHNARTKVGAAVQQAVVKGYSASQAVQEFLARGEAIPPEIAAKTQAAAADTVAEAAGAALLKDPEGAYAHAMRVFRTEINRAHGNAYRAGAEQTPGAIGTQFNLSPRHPRRDICDMYAKANLYGLGPGVYPHGKSPWPAHPNTLSFETIVFEDEVTEAHRQGKETALEWLRGQDHAAQADVLGSDAKAAALRAGHLSTGMIRAPWYSVKAKLDRKGVDTDKLEGQAA